MTDQAVRVERSGPVTTVLLHRPARRNAVDGPTAAQLAAAFRAYDADPDAAVAVLHGEGGVFCSGADLTAIGTERGNRVAPDGDAPMGVSRLRLSKPVIAAVSGYAVAGGLELALWCDLRVADETAVFGVFCRRWGVPLIDGGTVRLPRLIGASRAMDMILTGRAVDAAEAAAIGLANRLVPAGQALAAARELAAQLASFPQVCLRSDRASVLDADGLDEPAALASEFAHGRAALASEAVSGAARFAAGAGRHGTFDAPPTGKGSVLLSRRQSYGGGNGRRRAWLTAQLWPAGEGVTMPVQLVNQDPRYGKAHLIEPAPLGYLHLAADVEAAHWPGPVLRRSRDKQQLFGALKWQARQLAQMEAVETVTVYDALAFIPASGDATSRSALRPAWFDVVVLVETVSPAAASEVRASAGYQALADTLTEGARRVHHIAARNVRRVGDVDKSRPGLFVFNYLAGDDPDLAVELWEYLSGWYAAETGLDSATLFAPLEGEQSDYVLINHARWDGSLPMFAARQLPKKTFRSYLLANLKANHLAAMPVLYRLA